MPEHMILARCISVLITLKYGTSGPSSSSSPSSLISWDIEESLSTF